MKNKIIALILVVVMSVLALASCGSYNFAKEDLDVYATWADGINYDVFMQALKELQIEDAIFTTDEATREAIVKSDIYSAIVDKIIADTDKEDRNTKFEDGLTGGDVLYFVYYVTTPDKDGNDMMLYLAEFDPAKVTNTSSVIPHSLKMGAYLDEDKNADVFLQALKSALEGVTIKPYVTKTATELKDAAKEAFEADEAKITEIREKAEADLKAKHETENKEAPTEAELTKAADDAVAAALTAAQNAAIKVAEGQKLVISYTRTYKVEKKDADGNPVKDADGNIQYDTITESAKFEEIVVDPSNALHAKFLEEGATANIGADFVAVTERKDDGTVKTTAKIFDVTLDGKDYSYTALKFDWLVEDSGEAIVIKHTPYELNENNAVKNADGEWEREKNEDGSYKKTQLVAVDGLNKTSADKDGKVDILGLELTYHVFPIYAVDAPSYDEMAENNAYSLLYYLFGSALDEKDFDVLAEDYKWTDAEDATKTETVKDLLKAITDLYVAEKTVKKEDLQKADALNTYYFTKGEDGNLVATELWTLLEAYQTANKAAGTATSGEKYNAAQDALKALNDARKVELAKIIEKIANAKKDENVLGAKALEEYYKKSFDSRENSYETDIQKKINQAVWDKIVEFVSVDTAKIPEKLIKEFRDQIYEYHKYEYYVGPTSSSSSTTAKNYDTYSTFDAYLVAKGGLGLTTGFTSEQLEAALKTAAIAEIVPLVRIYFVAKEINRANGVEILQGYVNADIAAGAYKLTNDEIEFIKNTYPESEVEKVIKERTERATENEEDAKQESAYFLIDDAFMNMYKKEVGNVQYNNAVAQYGEINLRANFQINKLFYFLTSPTYEWNNTDGESQVVYTKADAEGNIYIDFKTVEYTIKAED